MLTTRRNAREILKSATLDEFNNIICKARLTLRQKYILQESLEKFGYQIAMELNVSPETVKTDLKKAYDKVSRVLLL